MFLTDPIVFPHLGITVDPAPVAFSIGSKAIYWYGIIIAIGFLAAYAYMTRRAPLYGCTSDDALDAVLRYSSRVAGVATPSTDGMS